MHNIKRSMLAVVAMAVVASALLSGVDAANSCAAGSSGSPCVPCPSGYYCVGGDAAAVACPLGYKCAAGASAPVSRLRGVNLSFGEINPEAVPGNYGTNYVYPNTPEMTYFKSIGFGVIRIPFAIGRMQPSNNAPLDATELGRLQTAVTNAIARNLTVLLDPHNYGMMYNISSGHYNLLGVPGGLPASVFGDFWSRLAIAFANQPASRVIFGLMNEPYAQTAVQWHDVAIVAINAIRATGATNKILIPGTSWTGAQSWVSSGNAAAWAGFTDTNFAFEVHQYLDSDNSGSHTLCQVGKGSSGLSAVTSWARTNGYELFLGEFGWANNTGCATEATTFVSYMTTNADVWLGWTYWAAGAWWGPYMYSIEPTAQMYNLPYTWREQTSILIANIQPAWTPAVVTDSSSGGGASGAGGASGSSSSTAAGSSDPGTSTGGAHGAATSNSVLSIWPMIVALAAAAMLC